MTAASQLERLHRGGAWRVLWAKRQKERGSDMEPQPVGSPLIIPARWNGQHDVYFAVHPLRERPANGGRGTEADVELVNCLYADFDGETWGALEQRLKEAGLPLPTFANNSGGGVHAYWLLTEPVWLDSPEALRRVKAIQKAWVGLVGGDPDATDLARILRVEGTHNRKPERADENGVAPQVRQVWDSDVAYDLFELERYLPETAEDVDGPVRLWVPQVGLPVNEPYLRKAWEGNLDQLVKTTEGLRNNALNSLTFQTATLCRSPEEFDMLAKQYGAAGIAIGLSPAEVEATIRSAIKDGKAKPRNVPDRGAPAARHGLPAAMPGPVAQELWEEIEAELVSWGEPGLWVDVRTERMMFGERAFKDSDAGRLRQMARKRGWGKGGKPLETLDEALPVIAASHPRHPVQEYLRDVGEKWDGKDHIAAVASYVHCTNPDIDGVPHFEAVLRRWAIGTVARVMGDDNAAEGNAVPTLVGPQGIGKSHYARWLCPRADWFSSAQYDPEGRDTPALKAHLMIWELGDLGKVTKADIDALKSSITSTTMIVRLPYDRHPATLRSMVSYIGGANLGANIFRDLTGNRRFWAAAVSRIDHAYDKKEDKHQFWAQAYQLWLADPESWQPTAAERDAFASAVTTYQFASMIDDYVAEVLTADPQGRASNTDIAAALKLTHWQGKGSVADGIAVADAVNRVFADEVAAGQVRRDKWREGAKTVRGFIGLRVTPPTITTRQW